MLVRSASSSNIKERRDCSAALFDADGRMVAQAEHIPVHLGAMPESVAAVIAREPRAGRRLRPQRPVRRRLAPAGHHARLPARVDGEIVGYAVHARPPLRCRRHRARLDAGGLDRSGRKGMVMPPVRLVTRRVVDDADSARQRPDAGDPRGPTSRAQAGGERTSGRSGWRELAARHGREIVLAAFDEVIDYAERRAREAIARAAGRPLRGRERGRGRRRRDDDLPIRVAVTIAGDAIDDRLRRARAGGGGRQRQLPALGHPLGLPLRAARRCSAPTSRSTRAPPRRSASARPRARSSNARSARRRSSPGNVETSQRIADTVLLALAQAADAARRRGRGR